MATDKSLTPEVTWAQRSSKTDEEKNFVHVTISASDVSKKDLHVDLQPTRITFKGYSSSKKATYEVELDLYAEIEPEKSKIQHSARDVEFKLQKKELNEVYWPRLLKDSKKAHFLKTDFDRWVDEDEQDAAGEDDYMSQFGGAGAGGMGGDQGFGGLDFSKLGGGAGMGGLGDMPEMPGGDEDEEGEEGDDEEMPDLEDEEEGVEKAEAGDAAGASASKTGTAKIEEVE